MPIVEQDSDRNKIKIKTGLGDCCFLTLLRKFCGSSYSRSSPGPRSRDSISTPTRFGVIFLNFSHTGLSKFR